MRRRVYTRPAYEVERFVRTLVRELVQADPAGARARILGVLEEVEREEEEAGRSEEAAGARGAPPAGGEVRGPEAQAPEGRAEAPRADAGRLTAWHQVHDRLIAQGEVRRGHRVAVEVKRWKWMMYKFEVVGTARVLRKGKPPAVVLMGPYNEFELEPGQKVWRLS